MLTLFFPIAIISAPRITPKRSCLILLASLAAFLCLVNSTRPYKMSPNIMSFGKLLLTI